MYKQLRSVLFLRDPEAAHDGVMQTFARLQQNHLGRAILRSWGGPPPSRPVEAMGLTFRHPLGVAAGFDKDARVVEALQELGFAFVEVGTVTPRPQPGNPKPRVWRFPEAHALVNALGFPGEGMRVTGERLARLRRANRIDIPIGVNLGKNKDTTAADAVHDYRAVFEHLYEVGDYFVVNVSSPNTAGLRDLQAVAHLKPLLASLMELGTAKGRKPLLVKIAPDLADEDVAAIGRLTRELGMAGIVAGNTTIQRGLVPRAASLDRGGLSGEPQFKRTRQLLAILRNELDPGQTLIAAGGISNRDHLAECLTLGAKLAQVYTAFIYHGPRCARNIVEGEGKG